MLPLFSIRISSFFMVTIAAGCIWTSSLHSAVTLYQEDFGVTNASYGSTTWLGYRDTNATILDSSSGASDLYYRGAFLNGPNNWNTPGSYAYVQTRGNATTSATAMNYFVHEANAFPAFVASDYTNLTASWSNYGNGTHRVALQVGGNWYVSTTSTNGGTGAGASAPAGSTYVTTSTLDLQNSNWSLLNFTAQETLNISTDPAISSTALFGLGQSITGFGFYINLSSTSSFQTWRFDTIAITGDLVPEPSRTVLLGLGVLGLVVNRKRRVKISRA